MGSYEIINGEKVCTEQSTQDHPEGNRAREAEPEVQTSEQSAPAEKTSSNATQEGRQKPSMERATGAAFVAPDVPAKTEQQPSQE